MDVQTRKTLRRSVLSAAIAAVAFGLTAGAQAAAMISNIELVGDAGGTLVTFNADNVTNLVEIEKTFTSVNPITLRFTVDHSAGGGNQFSVVEHITNNTGVNWSDYHVAVTNGPNGVVFNQFNKSTLDGFTLDSPPSSGPRNLNFTGSLVAGEDTHAAFLLSPNDPGAGNSYTFDLVQTPTTGGAPVPVPTPAWLLGSGLLALVRRNKKKMALAG